MARISVHKQQYSGRSTALGLLIAGFMSSLLLVDIALRLGGSLQPWASGAQLLKLGLQSTGATVSALPITAPAASATGSATPATSAAAPAQAAPQDPLPADPVQAILANYTAVLGREPPPGLNAWAQFALASGCSTEPDAYRFIEEDLAPLRAQGGTTAKAARQTYDTINYKQLISVRGHAVVSQETDGIAPSRPMHQFVDQFLPHLPDMDIIVNLGDGGCRRSQGEEAPGWLTGELAGCTTSGRYPEALCTSETHEGLAAAPLHPRTRPAEPKVYMEKLPQDLQEKLDRGEASVVDAVRQVPSEGPVRRAAGAGHACSLAHSAGSETSVTQACPRPRRARCRSAARAQRS